MPSGLRTLAVVVFGLFVALATLLTSIDATPVGTLMFWAAALVVMLGVWRCFLLPYVALTPEHLVVQGVFMHRAEPYASITAAVPGLYGIRRDGGNRRFRGLGRAEVEALRMAGPAHAGRRGGDGHHGPATAAAHVLG